MQRHLCILDSDEKETRLRWLRNLFIANKCHPICKFYYKSYALLTKSRREASTVIHPFSIFSLVWSQVTLLFILLAYSVIPLRSFEYDKNTKFYYYVMILIDIYFFCDIVLKLNTGFTDSMNSVVVLSRKEIALHYLRGLLIPDVLSTLPLDYFVLAQQYENKKYVVSKLLRYFRILRICQLFKCLKLTMEFFEIGIICRRVINMCIMTILNLHWFTCLSNLHSRYSDTFVESDDKNRYSRRFWTIFKTLFGVNFAPEGSPDNVYDVYFICLTVVFALVTMTYIFVVSLDTVKLSMDSKTKYYQMMNQVEKFTQRKELPPSIKHHLINYYDYKFQRYYFKESSTLSKLNDNLRKEVLLSSLRHLLEVGRIFQYIPKENLGVILGCLKREIFLPNELIFVTGSEGDCMYFISSGTVTCYTSSGKEIGQMEDGDYIGEVALLNKDSRRVRTVVAVEVTEVYRLSREDFRKYIYTCPPVFNRFEKWAAETQNRLILLETAHKKEKGQITPKNNSNEPLV